MTNNSFSPLWVDFCLSGDSEINRRSFCPIFLFDWPSGWLRRALENYQFWTTVFVTQDSLNHVWLNVSLFGNAGIVGKFICSITALGNTSPTRVFVPCSPWGISGIIPPNNRCFYHQVSWPLGLLRCELEYDEFRTSERLTNNSSNPLGVDFSLSGNSGILGRFIGHRVCPPLS